MSRNLFYFFFSFVVLLDVIVFILFFIWLSLVSSSSIPFVSRRYYFISLLRNMILRIHASYIAGAGRSC